MNDFQLTANQKQIRALARQFAENEIAPFASDWDQAGTAPADLLKRLGKLGLMTVCVAPAYGGAGADFLSYVLAMEEISAADGGVANMMSATNSPVAAALEAHGTEAQKDRYLRKLCSGDWVGCVHLTEPHTGSDAAAITTRAVRDGDDYVISGTKAFITGAASADLAMIVAVTDPDAGRRGISAFITPTDNPGYQIVRHERKLGHRGFDTCEVRFDQMRVPAGDMLGAPGRGLGIVLNYLSNGRIAVAAQAVGGARSAFEKARAYAKTRETFGKPIIDHQVIGFKLADMATQIEAARQLTWLAARLKDAGEDCAAQASMAKLFASEMAERVASDAIQIHGGLGYVAEGEVEKIYRDVRVYQIYEGTSEIQRLVIGRHIDQF